MPLAVHAHRGTHLYEVKEMGAITWAVQNTFMQGLPSV